MTKQNPFYSKIRAYITLMRPYQYTKNLFIFAPAFFGFGQYDITNPLNICAYLLGIFVCFSIICSGIYCFNDIIDAPFDRLHPSKSSRPIANGTISKKSALGFGILLIMLGGGAITILAFLCAKPYSNPFEKSFLDSAFFILVPICCYIILNLLYSLKLKHIAIADVFIISVGFVLRLWIGAIGIHISLSHWIIITTFLLALFLALAKRRDDVLLLENHNIKARNNINGYNKTFLDIAMAISASLVIVSYIFYSIDENANERMHTNNLYLTSIFVLLGIFRYMQITFVENNSSNPSKILLKDRFLQIVVLAWIASFILLKYLGEHNV